MFTINQNAEIRFVEMLTDIERDAEEWTALYFHLDRLMDEYKSDYQARIAVNLINDLLRHYDGGVFVMRDLSIMVVCYQLQEQVRNKLIFQLRYLYVDDPLAYSDSGEENPAFCTTYALAKDYSALKQFAGKLVVATGSRAAGKPRPKAPQRLNAASLADVERALDEANMESSLRRQSVCALLPGSKGSRRVFDEIYIHISHLREQLPVNVDFFSNKWLFKYLTQSLDRRVLEIVARNPGAVAQQPISVNINVETLLSDAFVKFNRLIPANAKVAVVFEVHVMDVFADTAAFLFARNEAQKEGYRICVDGLTVQNFPQINREILGFDLAKLQWNAEVDLASREHQQLADAVRVCGANRLILCRCDTKDAVAYGQSMGVSLFQGRFLDGLMHPKSEIEN